MESTASGTRAGPMAGRTVVVTRAPHQADELRERFQKLGASVVLFPTIHLAPPSDPGPLAEAAASMDRYDWLILTSVNGVTALAEALREAGWNGPGSASSLNGLKSCAIGPATAEAMIRELGVEPRVVPDEYVAEAVLKALDDRNAVEGRRVLIPRAAEARETLPEGLESMGARVDVVEAYRTLPADDGATELRARLDAGEIDVLTFTASSTVRNYHAALGADVGGARVAVIGPITAGTARELGLPVHIEAEEYTIPGLVQACAGWCEAGGPG